MIGWLVMAFIGGFILNLMPCVLPVISIKVLSFVQQAKESRVRVFTLGLAFSSGILLSFVALGGLIIGLGQQWGGLLQEPRVVIGLAAVVTAFALSLFGVFTLFAPRLVNELGEKVHQEGHLNTFGMGLLATVLGTACTAPFLSMVVAIAVQQPPAAGMLIFVAAGVGMAFPYVLLAAKPAWLRIVPKPGPWMKTFEQVMGFVLLATVVWLLNTLSFQLGGRGLVWALLYLLFVSMAVWFYGKVAYDAAAGRKLKMYGAAVLCVVGGWLFCFRWVTTIPALVQQQIDLHKGGTVNIAEASAWDDPGRIDWVPYTRARAYEAVNAGYTVFIDYTAEWCVSCKGNEIAFIDVPPVRATMARLGVVPFKADYTLRDPELTEDLKRHGRSAVPMYLIIPANRPEDVILLDEVPSQASIIENLEKAGPSVGGATGAGEGERASGRGGEGGMERWSGGETERCRDGGVGWRGMTLALQMVW
jgi:thiol:disulfide interchange protein DsbD